MGSCSAAQGRAAIAVLRHKDSTLAVAETLMAINVTRCLAKNHKKRDPAMSQSAAATQAVVDEKNAVYKRITLRLIPFIFICYLFNYLDRVNRRKV
jgi:hypothetical protein